MSHDQFTKKYLGRYVDYDGAFGAQCVDLMRQYCKEVLGVDGGTLPRAGYAKDIFKKYDGKGKFEKIFNSPSNVPQKGDIIFWDTRPPVTGIAGHVAIVERADVMNLISFDQNYPRPLTCRFVKHDFRGVMGWCRLKKPLVSVKSEATTSLNQSTEVKIETTTVTVSETPTVVAVPAEPAVTPVNELPEANVIPVNFPKSLIVRLVRFLIEFLNRNK
jgi:hypothetical protein